MKMRNSGIEWIREIPQKWNTLKLGLIFLEHYNKNKCNQENNLLSLSYGNIIRKNISNMEGLIPANFLSYNIIEAGDIVLRLTDLQNDHKSLRVGLVKEKGIITSAYITLRLKQNYEPQYFYYLLYSYDVMKIFYNMGNGVRQNLNFDELSELPLIVPTKKEQEQIADFLLKKCKNINHLIYKQRTLITKLQEYKQSLITQAVSKGLDPNVEMKDSGIEWIGKSPLSWQIVKLKYIALLNNIKCNNRTYQYVGLENIESKSGRLIGELSFTPEGDSLLVKKDQIIFGKLRPYLAKCYLANKTYSCSTEFMVFTPFKVSPQFLKYMLLNSAVINEFKRVSYGAKMPRIDPDYVMNMKFILPYSMQEQIKITKYLDDKCGQIDKLITQKQNFISMLDEHKKSLIYEYVTGKKTVGEN